MAKGTIELERSSINASASYIVGKIDWESTPDNDRNESDVTARLYVKKANDSLTLTEATYGTWAYELTVNGERISGTTIASVLSDWVLIATKTVADIDHNGDGTKSISISGSVTAPTGTSYAYKKSSGSGTAKLDNIPRASTITDLVGDIGKRCTIRWTPASGKFRFKVKLSLGDWSYTSDVISPGSTSRYTYSAEIPLEVAEQITNSKTGNITVSLYTYSDAAGIVQVGSASTKTLKVTVPENSQTLPAVTVVTSAVHTLPDAFSGLYIQGKSKVKVTSKPSAKLGASIKSCTVKVDGVKHTGTTVTTDYLANYGGITVSVTVVDSRGYSATKNVSLTVIPYGKPSILPAEGEKFVVATRCDAEGNVTDSGTYLQIKAKRSYSKVASGDAQKNFCKIRFRYKQEKADAYSSWVTILAGDSLNSDEIVTGPLLEGALTVKNTYLVQVEAIDDIGEHSYTTIKVPTDKVYMHRDGARNALGIGKYVEEDNCIDIAEDIKLKIRSEKWVSLGLSNSVSESESNCGRGSAGTGCFYRVVNDNHVQVAFNCAFAYSGEPITVNLDAIPAEYRPSRNVYAICATGGRAVARILVNSSGNILVDWIQILSSAEATAESAVNWIDGYIDYFV